MIRCRWGDWGSVVAALLVGFVMLVSVWAAKHSGARLDAADMLWIEAAAGAAYLVLQRVLARR